MRPFNPTRRNRNIGTAAQGHGHDNRLVIPDSRRYRRYEEALTSYVSETHQVHGNQILFIIEKTLPDWFHACSVDDVQAVLHLMRAEDLESIGCILFRQPTRKQIILNPAWGRLTYAANVGIPGEPDLYVGPLITLEACAIDTVIKWSKSLRPELQQELERLKNDGHDISTEARKIIIRTNKEAIRNTQLYHTLLHELGHWVDFLEKVERPSGDDLDKREEFLARYFARPFSEREAFAHRYAASQRTILQEAGLL